LIQFTAPNGSKSVIQVGKRCADLWVAPDESVIAFIGIERAAFGTENDASPAIDESSVYIARKAENFKPIRLPFDQVAVEGALWRVFRSPSISPDLRTAYFTVPVTMKDWKLMSIALPSGVPQVVHDVSEYCVIWGGPHSGALITMENVYAPRYDGIRCFVPSVAGRRTRTDDGDCTDFGAFASRWARQHRGGCTTPGFGVDSQVIPSNGKHGPWR
jgi:hypothetical protein